MPLLALLMNKYVLGSILAVLLVISLYGLYVGHIDDLEHKAVLNYEHQQYIDEQSILHDILVKDNAVHAQLSKNIEALDTSYGQDLQIITPMLQSNPWSKVQIPQNIASELNTKVIK